MGRYAKALHYKEEEFHRGASSQVFETLILINNKLQQKEAAQGLLEYVMQHRASGDTQLQVIKLKIVLHNNLKVILYSFYFLKDKLIYLLIIRICFISLSIIKTEQ